MTRLPSSTLSLASRALIEGKLVGIPTETVYGLAGNALNSAALASIFEVKQRPHFDPLIVHLAAPDAGAWEPWWDELFESRILDASGLQEAGWNLARRLASAFWPGPLTLVLPKGRAISDLATSGLNTVGIRVPAHPLAQALLRECRLPLAAPSANRFGRISPTTADHVRAELGDHIPSVIAWVLDGGPCTVGVESTVAQVLVSSVSGEPSLLVLRPGGASAAELEKVAGFPVRSGVTQGVLEKSGLAAPGMLASHYAPKKKMILVRETETINFSGNFSGIHANRIGLIHLTAAPSARMQEVKDWGRKALPNASFYETSFSSHNVISASDIAQHLFAKLREMDESEAEVLIVEQYPSTEGLGAAIRDRLERAATKAASV